MTRRRVWRLRREDAGTEFEIDGEVIVGRGRTARLRLDETKVSRRHARLWLDADDAMLEDLASTNGTHLNGRRLHASTPLVPGDRIAFDTVVFVVEATFEDAVAKPAPSERQVTPPGAQARRHRPRDRAGRGPSVPSRPRPVRWEDERTVVAPREASFDLGASDFEDDDGGPGGRGPA